MKEVNRNSKAPNFVRRIELVQKRSIMYYQQQTSQPFLKIVVALPTMVTSCRGNYLSCLSFFSMKDWILIYICVCKCLKSICVCLCVYIFLE